MDVTFSTALSKEVDGQGLNFCAEEAELDIFQERGLDPFELAEGA